MSQLYESLKSTSRAEINLGTQSIPVQVLLRGDISTLHLHDYREDAGLGLGEPDKLHQDIDRDNLLEEEGEEVRPALYSRARRVPRFLPWQTLLPLEDPEVLRESVPEESFLHRFIEIWSPTLSCVSIATSFFLKLTIFPQ
jgi:hypothetical protein